MTVDEIVPAVLNAAFKSISACRIPAIVSASCVVLASIPLGLALYLYPAQRVK